MTHPRRISILLSLLLLFAIPVMAQYEEDDQTRDYEEMDRRYLERHTKSAEDETPLDTAEVAAAYLAKAEELIRDASYRSRSSEGYRAQTDDPRLDTRAVVDLLDSFRAFFYEFWADRADVQKYDRTSRVFLFYSFYKYNQLIHGDWSLSWIRPQGHYRSDIDVITLHTDASSSPNLPDVLIHEAAHQLIERGIYTGDGHASSWIAEGMASYFGYTYRDKDGRFQAGQVGGKETVLVRKGSKNPPSESRMALRAFKSMLKNSDAEGSVVERLVAAEDPSQFYGDSNVLMRYAASWLLVHFLFHGDDGAHAEEFVRYIELEAQGKGGQEAFYREIGMDAAAISDSLAQHVKSIKLR